MKGIRSTNTSQVKPPVIKSTRQDTSVATQKDAQQHKDVVVETQMNPRTGFGTEGLEANKTASPRGMKHTAEMVRTPYKNQRSQRAEQDETIKLTDRDLEQIADAVTLATEDRWVALEEKQWAAFDTIQAKLRMLQLKVDTLPISATPVCPPFVASNATLATYDSHLCSLRGATLVLSPSNLGPQVQTRVEVKLNLAWIPMRPCRVSTLLYFRKSTIETNKCTNSSA